MPQLRSIGPIVGERCSLLSAVDTPIPSSRELHLSGKILIHHPVSSRLTNLTTAFQVQPYRPQTLGYRRPTTTTLVQRQCSAVTRQARVTRHNDTVLFSSRAEQPPDLAVNRDSDLTLMGFADDDWASVSRNRRSHLSVLTLRCVSGVGSRMPSFVSRTHDTPLRLPQPLEPRTMKR